MIEYVEAKSIVSKISGNANAWFGHEYNMNIYRGCNHGCIYCDSRSEVYGVENFDKVKVKKDALKIIEKDLKSKRHKGVIGTGAMSDPYNKLEEELELTRDALKLIDKYGFGVAIATKSDLIVRDIDILKKIAEHSPVIVKITITCSNDDLTKLIEPNVTVSSKRFIAIQKLRDAGIYAGVLLMPVLPFVTDSWLNIEQLLKCATKYQANFVYGGFGVTQRLGQRIYYLDKLSAIDEQVATAHEKLFGNTYSCPANNVKQLYEKFEKYCKENNLKYKMKDIINDYKKGYRNEQISLF